MSGLIILIAVLLIFAVIGIALAASPGFAKPPACPGCDCPRCCR